MKDHYNAFVDENVIVKPVKTGNLSGRTFAVKDVFDIKGITSSAGNPDWLRTHTPAEKNAVSIELLLQSGATLTGTTITDELMYSLNGENYHYGTPVNPKAEGHIPGGSSSGSAVAASSGVVDFAIGTDTGGSVRIPAAYCGVYGFRPTHGLVPINGVIPLAESFDTVGWMTSDPQLLLEVGSSLIKENRLLDKPFASLLFGTDAWELADEKSKEVLETYTDRLGNELQSEWLTIAEGGLQKWASCFRTLQGLEIWKNHGKWINEVNPSFGPDIAARFDWASTLREEDKPENLRLKETISTKLLEVLGEDQLLIIPTTPGEAPLCNLSGEEIEERRSQTMQLSCIAGLTGFPQVTIPIEGKVGMPIALSVIAGPNQDRRLLQWVYENTSLFA
ncbi:amidase [Halalkalibacter alkaliphilus]|uniref:Amidase n=1 Tax=Halalkalibacter alkaliphilus TaxID=2917993 RepID=A0A9X2CT07_9BACI|nr:amidase [Halalkalibacter alkaliphilus]MCL7747718.1 amidase [Halalkalibacter alkaliphilus]